MIDRSEKYSSHSSRQDRQFRPILNGIIFLLAANLVAKGALGLEHHQSPLIPGNVQGSLFLSLNQPNKLQQQFYPTWYPLANHVGQSSTLTPRPISQTQIVSIGEPIEDIEHAEDFQRKEGYVYNKVYRFNSIEDPLEPASSEEVKVKTSTEEPTTTVAEETTTINTDVEILPKNFTSNTDSQEIPRQASNQTATEAPARPTQATVGPMTTKPAQAMSTETTGQQNAMNTTMTNVTNVYGPPNLVYGPPPGNTSGQNMTNPNDTNPYPYPYLPSGNYGPWTGNENITITYGPPSYQPPFYEKPYYPRPVYQKPFLSSPEDHYLNNYNQYQYNNFQNRPPYYNNDGYKYNDFFKSFYSKFDYNYPSFYSNYLGKK